jgi:hypothetical protein
VTYPSEENINKPGSPPFLLVNFSRSSGNNSFLNALLIGLVSVTQIIAEVVDVMEEALI